MSEPFFPSRRIGRLWYLFCNFGLLMLMGATNHIAASHHTLVSLVWFLVSLVLLLGIVFAMKDRLNDFGWSGWWMLIPFVSLVILFVPGDAGPNKYGNAP